MKSNIIVISVFILSVVCALASAPQQVSAASIYDNTVRTVSNAQVKHTDCDPLDVSQDWLNMLWLNEEVSPESLSVRENIYIEAHNWGVSINDNGTSKTVMVWFSKVPVELSFDGTPPLTSLLAVSESFGTNVGAAFTFSMQSDCETVTASLNQDGGIAMGISDENDLYMYFAFADSILYPDGYEGDVIPDVPPVFVDNIVGFAPNFYLQSLIGFRGVIIDTNFATFDRVPFLCEGDTTPVMEYEIWHIPDPILGLDDVLIGGGIVSPTVPLEFTFPSDTGGDLKYRVLGWYYCGNPPDLQFVRNSYIDFTVTRNGTLYIDIMEGCLLEEFPFVDLNGCLDNMYSIFNVFAGVPIDLPNWTYNFECRPLYMMDDWLNLPEDYVVCAQVPEVVRDVVTPFVAFMLGIVTLGFIKQRKGDLNHG